MSFYEKLLNILKSNSNYLDSNGCLLKAKIIDDAEQCNSQLITLLLQDEEIKSEFCTDIESVCVFNVRHFVQYIKDKNFLNESYTDFSNKIGLSIKNKLLSTIDDVSLVFPYKDCVLEGGQNTEEQTRKEIFFNKILAKDEINRLLSPKALVNFEKWDKDAIQKGQCGSVKTLEESDNLLIKGNNLLSLYCLREKYKGKVKLIYIDPPYNTGTDSFNYNDSFTHSTWLTFMKNRLEVAKDLLTEDGSIYVQIDVKEAHYLKVLMDEIFGRNNFRSEIIWDTSVPYVAGNKWLSNNWIYSHSAIFYYAKNKNLCMFNKQTFDVKQPSGDVSKKPYKDVWVDIENFAGFLGAKDIKIKFDSKKPEKLLERIIKSSSNEGDIVLDFFTGSGTTAAVAHKLKRRWITCEQIDGQVEIAKQRLCDVISGEQLGISKSAGWNGGGSFVYCELATYNQNFINKISDTENKDDLLKIWSDIKDKGFLLYNIDIKKFDENISDFQKLSVQEQKDILINILNMNMLYVPLSEIEDNSYSISQEDIQVNKMFYGAEYTHTEV